MKNYNENIIKGWCRALICVCAGTVSKSKEKKMKLSKTLSANFPGFYNSNHTADRFSASRISFMHDFPETRGSQL
ncbi:hypothetical protein [Lactobacillus delbrueckii]|uniref:hypothetical protein n=1 Tax=Lactobacillus delbrueckii TaxID=1584 RepID=UPI0035D0FC59